MYKDFRAGFLSLTNLLTNYPLVWKGNEIPNWLNGKYFRNGSGLYDLGEESYKHFFDGLAMIHAYEFQNGKATYTNKFLNSKDYQKSTSEKKIAYTEFASTPERNLFQKIWVTLHPSQQFGDNASINFMDLAHELVAISDVPVPMEIDFATTNTVGEFTYTDSLNLVINSPHPQYDSIAKENINFGIELSVFGPQYVIFKIKDGTRERVPICKIPTLHASYMHSFIVSENYIILTEHPLVLDLLTLVSMGMTGASLIQAFHWKAELGTTFLVVEKTTGKLAGKFKVDPFFTFHHVNAFEKDGELLVDLSTYPNMDVIDKFYLSQIFSPNGGNIPAGELRRYSLNLSKKTSSYKVLSNQGFEMPIINPDFFTLPYQFTYGVSCNPQKPNDFNNQIIKIDVNSGKYITWFEEGTYPTEPVFVKNPNSRKEDAGVCLSVVLDAKNQNSFLLVLDAESFTEIARATIPHLIPFGFHGIFAQASEFRKKN